LLNAGKGEKTRPDPFFCDYMREKKNGKDRRRGRKEKRAPTTVNPIMWDVKEKKRETTRRGERKKKKQKLRKNSNLGGGLGVVCKVGRREALHKLVLRGDSGRSRLTTRNSQEEREKRGEKSPSPLRRKGEKKGRRVGGCVCYRRKKGGNNFGGGKGEAPQTWRFMEGKQKKGKERRG